MNIFAQSSAIAEQNNSTLLIYSVNVSHKKVSIVVDVLDDSFKERQLAIGK